MDDSEFDAALITAAFEQAGLTGWRSLSIVEAARTAGLPLDRARARFPVPAAVLMRFGVLADQMALAEPATEPSMRARLFDLLMRRFDALQQHRSGVLALLEALPGMPGLSLALTAATGRSMGWMLEAAGASAQGLTGTARITGLVGVWLHALRAWRTDESADLAGTMAALDKALDQAETYSSYLGGGASAAETGEPLDPFPDAAVPPETSSAPTPVATPGVEEAPNPSFPPPPPAVEPPASPI